MALRPRELVFGRYLVEAPIGRGGMGEVWRARHLPSGEPVALKVLNPFASDTAQRRFSREAEVMARVHHPNVVRLLDFGPLPSGEPCLVMEYVAGETIERRLQRYGALPWDQAFPLLVGILQGLEALHGAGILHRDLKPDNIALVSAPGPAAVKLLDLGIARPLDDGPGRLTATGAFLGTPAYMAPEQLLSRPVDARSDLFSAALVFFEIVSGGLPFESDSLVALAARAQMRFPAPEPLPGFPPLDSRMAALIVRTLSPDPDERPASARDLLRELAAVRRVSGGPQRVVGDPGFGRQGAARRVPTPPPTTVGWESRPAEPPAEPEPVEAPVPAAPPTRRGLLVARVPKATLERPETQQWLTRQLGDTGHSRIAGDDLWVATFLAPLPSDVPRRAERLVQALRSLFGSGIRVRWRPVCESFVATAPEGGSELASLMAEV